MGIAAGRLGVPSTCCARRSRSRNGSVRISMGNPLLGWLVVPKPLPPPTANCQPQLEVFCPCGARVVGGDACRGGAGATTLTAQPEPRELAVDGGSKAPGSDEFLQDRFRKEQAYYAEPSGGKQ